MPHSEPLLEARGLTKHFRVGGPFSRRFLHAVDDVDLAVHPKEIVALVGESGSGKSTVAQLLALLYQPTRGEITFHGRTAASLRRQKEQRAYRRRVQMVFQDPFSSLNPVYPASHGIMRALRLYRSGARREMARGVLESVGLIPAEEFLQKYPHELSGGQRQRIGFAQALACEPELILADEPVSMLDVSIRIGVLNLMARLRDRHGVSFVYITHDLASARYVAERVLVMYGGHIVESGPVDDVLQRPKHPYTQLLLTAVPDPAAPPPSLAGTEIGEPPRIVDPPEGCRFRDRCPVAIKVCSEITPRLRPMRRNHTAACHVAESELSGDGAHSSAGSNDR